ncbi:MAG: amidase [Alphaproteobacteria bacterium]|nr:amidase [Alphaproteobacteria bacterium]
MNEPCDLSAVEARRLIGRKRLSPIELLESCIARIEMVNPTINAVVATCYDRARDEARVATDALLRGDDLPPLHGLPIGVKDLNDTEGLRTTYGSPLYADHIPEKDERMVAALRKAGAIVLAKTNTPEFGAGGNTNNAVYGPTVNPFDITRTAGGSSGGSAAALATNMLPLCTGSDTGGSLRRPATYNGVVALRPTVGLVPSDRRALGLSNYGTLGPMARTVEDTALLLSGMAGEDMIDPMSFPHDVDALRRIDNVDLGGLRVAVSEDLGGAPVDNGMRKVFRKTLAHYGPVFGSCVDRDPDFATANDVFWILRGVYFVGNHKERYEKHRDQLGANVLFNIEAGLKMTVEEIAWANTEQTRLYRGFQSFFEDIDILICPGAPIPPFPYDQRAPEEINGVKMDHYISASAISSWLTLTGHPVVALPCGYDETGTPFGIQIVGPRHGDRFVLGVAHALEELLSRNGVTKRPIPDIRALAAPE